MAIELFDDKPSEEGDSYAELEREVLYEKDRIRFVRMVHSLPDGGQAEKGLVVYPEAVGALAINQAGEVLLVRQHRVGAAQNLWEIPAGKLDEGESPEQGIVREMREESGLRPRSLQRVFSYYPAPGISSELIHLFWAEDLSEDSLGADVDEFIQKAFWPLSQLERLLYNGEIRDAKTIIAIQWYLLVKVYAQKKD